MCECETLEEATTTSDQPSEQAQDEVEVAINEAIASCGGDARVAVKALLMANASLENELAMTVPAVSYGYSKGWHARRRG